MTASLKRNYLLALQDAALPLISEAFYRASIAVWHISGNTLTFEPERIVMPLKAELDVLIRTKAIENWSFEVDRDGSTYMVEIFYACAGRARRSVRFTIV